MGQGNSIRQSIIRAEGGVKSSSRAEAVGVVGVQVRVLSPHFRVPLLIPSLLVFSSVIDDNKSSTKLASRVI